MPKAAILCVDDEILVWENLEIKLHKAFDDLYLYEFAERADEALEILEEIHDNNVDIMAIISDWLRLGIRGYEFLIPVSHKFFKIIKIILTEQADEAAIELAKKQPIFMVIAKTLE